jgi:hypothetical protein
VGAAMTQPAQKAPAKGNSRFPVGDVLTPESMYQSLILMSGSSVYHLWSMLIILCSWRNAKFIAMDANFAQKARLRPNDPHDLPLGPGYANFVDYKLYAEHLKNYIHKDEVCTQFR